MPNTYRLHVRVKGSGDPVVLLHGQLSTGRYLNDVIAHLQEKRQTFCPDLLGFGRSPRPRRAKYSIDQHVAALHDALLDKNISKPFVLMGHSMGAQIALAYTVAHPSQVKAVVLSALPLFIDKKSAYSDLAKINDSLAWMLSGKRARILGLLPRLIVQPLAMVAAFRMHGAYPRYVVADIARHSWPAFKRSLDNVVVSYDPKPDLKRIKLPMFLFFATDDSITPDPERQLAPLLSAQHTLKILKGSHQIPLEHPKAIADALLSL